jgi:hypothetical protein
VVAAEVSFEGADIGPVVGTGATDLEALTHALRLGTAALDSFRAGGGRVLYDTHGFGLEPFDQPLEHFFRMTLRQFGLPEESNDAEIVEGPTPEATGYVVIKVRVGENVYRGLACTLGFGSGAGIEDGDLETKSKVMRAVDRFMDEHRSEALGWYREAAKLRRAAGNPPLIGASTARHASVVGRPQPRGRAVLFRTQGAPAELRVFVLEAGGVIDDCDDWMKVTDVDRDSAFTGVLEYVFANREESAALGIDIGLLEELYR